MASKSRIVVLTDQRDAHLPFVQSHLTDPLIIIDPHDMISDGSLTYEITGSSRSLIVNGKPLRDIQSVWFRKPITATSEEIPVDDDFSSYAVAAMREHYSQLFTEFSTARWMSDYYSMRRAGNKVHQLTFAKSVGLPILPTIFTSNEEHARAFIGQHERVVAKPMSAVHPKLDGKQQVLFTMLLDQQNPPDLSGLPLAPSIFQAAAQVDYDIRVAVVGERIFPARVKSERTDDGPGIYDSRLGHYEGGLEITEEVAFPESLARKCISLVKQMNLNFGALDFVRDAAGDYWFLEINPNGQWAYVEQATGQPIGAAIADFLSDH